MKRCENKQKRVEEISGEESADDGMKQEIEIWTLQLQSGCCRYSSDPTAAVRNQLEKRRWRRALGPAKVSISQLGVCMCYFWLGVPAVQTRDSPCANCRDRLSKGFIFLSSSPHPTGDGSHRKGPCLAVSSTFQTLWFHTNSLFSCAGALCWPPTGARRWQHAPGVLCVHPSSFPSPGGRAMSVQSWWPSKRHLRGLCLLQSLKTGKLPPCPSPHQRLGSFLLLFQARPMMGNTSPVVHSWGSCPSKSPLETSLHFHIAQAPPRVISIYYCRVG